MLIIPQHICKFISEIDSVEFFFYFGQNSDYFYVSEINIFGPKWFMHNEWRKFVVVC